VPRALAGLNLVGETLYQLAPVRSDLAAVQHQHDPAGEIPLGDARVEPHHNLPQADPAQHKGMLNG
jgi:hypothetical protein